LDREKLLRQGIESALEELELRPLLSTVVENACRLLGAETGGVGLVEEGPRRMVMLAVHNLPESEIGTEWQPGVGIAGLILTMGRPMIVNRYGDIDPQKRPELAEDAVVGVPILRRKRLIGFFGIGASAPRQFTRADVKILSQFANACAVAIENTRLFEFTQESLKQTQLLYSTATTLSQAIKLDDVVRSYLGQIALSLKVNCMVIVYERNESGDIGWNVARGRCSATGEITTFVERTDHETDNLDNLLENGDMVLFSDISKDARAPKSLRTIQMDEGHPALALVPLVSRGKRVGLVTLSRPRVHEWTDPEIQPFAVTSAHLAAAIDIRQEQERLAEERANLALVEERKRLARDLHDSVTQSLFAMQLLSQAIVCETSEAGTTKANQLANLCRSSLREMRALLSELRPIEDSTKQHHHPLTEVLRSRLERHIRELGMEATVNIDDADYFGSPPETEHALFRIAQEALTNAHKHSQATRVTIKIATKENRSFLQIEDNGVGLIETDEDAKGRLGLVGMTERAYALRGTINITSKPGKGVTIQVEAPN